ncbi:amino acid amidase [candidate division KSB3 bacterium]|uniref:Amino acid amidase n=1 Tax=candidate division KSB3 bacterium TaxID=2044937 RepID=A0A2G6KJS6_9BACT|nr:MAG: amino acid amidase [candidate division KSB3 bacterium]
MKIYISADIEGVTGVTHWDEANKEKHIYKIFQEQMTREVAAACEGALAAGAAEILLKDAHGSGRNILPDKLPEEVKIIRGWSGHPLCMVQELDESFDALLFVGYHSRAGANTNPLAHSLALAMPSIKINDRFASEFLLHSYAAAMQGVPVAFLSGDDGVCQDVKAMNGHIETVAVKQGIGGSTLSIHPNLALQKIRTAVQNALQSDLSLCHIPLPEKFNVEIRYTEHPKAYRASYYPGARPIDSHTIGFHTTDYFEVLRLLLFVGS